MSVEVITQTTGPATGVICGGLVLLRDVRPGEHFRDGNIECRMVGPCGANMHYEYRNSFGWQSAYMPWWHKVAQENTDSQTQSRISTD